MTQASPAHLNEGVEQPRPSRLMINRDTNIRSNSYTNMTGPATNGVATNKVAAATMGTKPTLISVTASSGQLLKFLIMDTPRQSNLHLYMKEMRKHSVTCVVRACEPTYQGTELQNAGIKLYDMEYADGHSPPKEVIDQWLELVDSVFFAADNGKRQQHQNTSAASSDGSNNNNNNETSPATPCIAIHCVAGLGRAPQLVALAMIEFVNMDAVDAVSMIRKHRRGAINEKQLTYLEGYKRSYNNRKRGAGGSGGEGGCCIIQ